MTRITQSMLSRSTLHDLQNVRKHLADTQRKISSGKEIARPSDDPFAAGRALSLRADVSGLEQYKRTAADAEGWARATDTALGSITDIAQRARELLLQGANDTLPQPARNAVAAEIDQLIAAAKNEGNATYAGRYLFAGTATDTRPYADGPGDAFGGNGNDIARQIGPSVSVAINVNGGAVLGDGADGKLLDTLRSISSNLRAGDPAALRATDLAALDANIDGLLETRAGVGATSNRLEAASGRLAELIESSSKLLSDTEDADMAETLIEYSMQQSVYQSALKAGANVIQPSLMDFLR